MPAVAAEALGMHYLSLLQVTMQWKLPVCMPVNLLALFSLRTCGSSRTCFRTEGRLLFTAMLYTIEKGNRENYKMFSLVLGGRDTESL